MKVRRQSPAARGAAPARCALQMQRGVQLLGLFAPGRRGRNGPSRIAPGSKPQPSSSRSTSRQGAGRLPPASGPSRGASDKLTDAPGMALHIAQRLARHSQHHGGALVLGRRRRHRYAPPPALPAALGKALQQGPAVRAPRPLSRAPASRIWAMAARAPPGRWRPRFGVPPARRPAARGSSAGPACASGGSASAAPSANAPACHEAAPRRGRSRHGGMAAWRHRMRHPAPARLMRVARCATQASSSVLSWVGAAFVLPLPVIGHQAWNAR